MDFDITLGAESCLIRAAYHHGRSPFAYIALYLHPHSLFSMSLWRQPHKPLMLLDLFFVSRFLDLPITMSQAWFGNKESRRWRPRMLIRWDWEQKNAGRKGEVLWWWWWGGEREVRGWVVFDFCRNGSVGYDTIENQEIGGWRGDHGGRQTVKWTVWREIPKDKEFQTSNLSVGHEWKVPRDQNIDIWGIQVCTCGAILIVYVVFCVLCWNIAEEMILPSWLVTLLDYVHS